METSVVDARVSSHFRTPGTRRRSSRHSCFWTGRVMSEQAPYHPLPSGVLLTKKDTAPPPRPPV